MGPRIELESHEIGGWLALKGHLFSRCDFGFQLLCDFLSDLALDGEQLVYIAVVLLDPDVGVRACVDQLRVEAKMRAGSADAALQNMRHTQIITDLTKISLATVIHHAGPADDFQIGDSRQLGQKVVLNAIDESSGVFSLLA